MKILHSALMSGFTSGIVNQMFAEYLSARKLNLNLDVRIFSQYVDEKHEYDQLFISYQAKSKNKITSWLEFRINYYNWLLCHQDKYDCFILRYSVNDPLLTQFLYKCKKPVFLVHHTKEVVELKTFGIKGNILSLVESICGKISLRKCKGIIGVTHEIINYELNRINCNKINILYPNGIIVTSEKLENLMDESIPQFLFIASYFYEWHGLDLLIDAVKRSNSKFIIHLVGDIQNKDLQALKSENRFVHHGRLSSKEINKLSKFCRVGLSSFALHRKGMQQACTLKVREYLSMGLGVYANYDEVFSKEFKYYKKGPIEIDEIISFSRSISKESKDNIRNESKEFISKDILLSNLIQKIHKVIEE